jgi:hypothetical protein
MKKSPSEKKDILLSEFPVFILVRVQKNRNPDYFRAKVSSCLVFDFDVTRYIAPRYIFQPYDGE